jgi:hypothetical protein
MGKGHPGGVSLGNGGARGWPPPWRPALIGMKLALPFRPYGGIGHVTTTPVSHISI